jgi:branched-chain amino acid transport system permease protein
MSANIRPSGVFDTAYEQDISLNRTRGDKLWSYGLFLALLVVPLLTIAGPFGLNIVPSYYIGIVNNIAIFIIAVQGLNILLGYTGQISLGHAAFMAVGAYSAGILARELGMSFWLAVPSAALITGIVGLIFGLPSLRVKGFYLAMATLAAQFIIPWILENPLEKWTNGTNPISIPHAKLGSIELNTEIEMFYVIVPLSVLLMLLARNIVRTRTGRAFVSIRDNDLAAELLGINVFWYKLQAFFLSSLYAGIAGALIAYNNGSISPETFNIGHSIEMLAMLVIGGMGFQFGPLFGVGFIHLLEKVFIPGVTGWLTSPSMLASLVTIFPFLNGLGIRSSMGPIMFGLVLVIFLILEPRGLAYRWEILRTSWKIRPFSH